MNTFSLQAGTSYKVKKISKNIDKNYRHKLLSMGIMPGSTFRIERVAPLGDPLYIIVKDYALCIRRKELALLELESIL
ncbi:Ferrous iron transport protein A [Piscirickettsia salmonis]|uniref:FeoA domain-containing protein n=1 Tax=Piscirickettsia salmonis TaxID=1238 RepID=UPI0012BA9E93|nr:FeoA domain-containing protein [Piscirickettsia salmonis]QGP56165.1 Ferrous iron transport protein A [Piscirickettsia salmonis]QGP57967.1 Ferrous iron transport protein A [Piscirickettsia salmonis]QGP65734.1 Ferrous iron transport protein A [Piscirickettsia salmonis]